MSCDREDQRRKTDEHKRICKHISVCNHRAPPLQEVDNLAVLTGRRIIAQSAALCQFAALGAAFLLVQLRELFRDVLGDGTGRHLDAVAVRVVGELVARGDIDLRASAGKVACHDGLHDAVLDTRIFAQTVGHVGDFDGLAVGCDSLVSSHCFVLLFFVQNLFIIGVAFAGNLLDAGFSYADHDLARQKGLQRVPRLRHMFACAFGVGFLHVTSPPSKEFSWRVLRPQAAPAEAMTFGLKIMPHRLL